MKDLLRFCTNPKLDYSSRISIQQKLRVFFGLLLIEFTITIVFLIPLGFIHQIGEINTKPKVDLVTSGFFTTRLGWLSVVIILTPVYEEVTTRLFLIFRRESIVLSLFFFIGFICFTIFNDLMGLLLVISVLVALLILFQIWIKIPWKRLENFWLMQSNYIFYFSIFLFSFMHATSYQFESIIQGLLILILLLPIVLSGFILGYTRVKLGFGWGVFLHISMNTIYALISISGTHS